MGYRHYFYEIPIAEVEKIKDMDNDQFLAYIKATSPEAIEEDNFFMFEDVAGQKRIYEFGKLYFTDFAARIREQGKPLFTHKDRQAEDKPFIVGKPGILEAIELYRQTMIKYYENLLVEHPSTEELCEAALSKTERQENFIKKNLYEWEKGFVVNLRENREQLTNSDKIEYQIFELVRLLKTIDWERKTVLFYGF